MKTLLRQLVSDTFFFLATVSEHTAKYYRTQHEFWLKKSDKYYN